MSAAGPTATGAQTSGLARPRATERAVPVHARRLAARLSASFKRDVKIVERLNDAQHRLQEANERLWSGPAPNAFGLLYDGAAVAATGTSAIAALIRDGGPAANSPMLAALQNVHWTIHRTFCRYQLACEDRRQLAVEVGELSQQLTDALAAAGWSAHEAQHANVHELARVAA